MTPDQLFASYGEGFKGNFNPHTRNVRSGKISSQKHHCKRCEAPPTKRCYINFHIAFCLHPVPVSKEKDAPTMICGERFAVNSPQGCYTHSYANGCNEGIKNMKLGKEDKVVEEPAPAPVAPVVKKILTKEQRRLSEKMQRESWKVEAASNRASKVKGKLTKMGGSKLKNELK
ncbi:hypothetical protein GRF29_164g1529037 [Pseudopithomyces chartarum]|uniref:Uncharacterized protein n=1 Tax=Pseudopithomyces chartarum TaxID=1892770 RepID=A0AAN6LPU4_9PLEO|nr:hypothetical protein GRF29_164g1529037 [Pseudopithomyces chartarum]